jgi:hypothetical protein
MLKTELRQFSAFAYPALSPVASNNRPTILGRLRDPFLIPDAFLSKPKSCLEIENMYHFCKLVGLRFVVCEQARNVINGRLPAYVDVKEQPRRPKGAHTGATPSRSW